MNLMVIVEGDGSGWLNRRKPVGIEIHHIYGYFVLFQVFLWLLATRFGLFLHALVALMVCAVVG